MTPSYSQTSQDATLNRYSREETIRKVLEFKEEHTGLSQRAFAKKYDLPCTTFQDWKNRKERLQQENEAATAFFESPQGLEWLHRITTAAQFVITPLAGGSVRDVSQFLQLS